MKTVYPIIMKAFKSFEFVDKELYKMKPANNVLLENNPEIFIKVKV